MQNEPFDHYETLQISPNAEPDTIHRVYRLLAQRFHPDNKETGSTERFRQICDAYAVLSDPQRRAEYDVDHQRQRHDRWRLVTEGADPKNDFDMERAVRVTILEVLYTQRRMESRNPGLFPSALEDMIGVPHEHMEFTIWFLIQKKLVQRSDNSTITITADGVEYLENNSLKHPHRRQLRASTSTH